MEESRVEAVAASLIREFLSRKGLKKTSLTLDEELPRTAHSINNRNQLRAALHLDPLYKENKSAERPLKTLLELITKFFLDNIENNKRLRMRGEQNSESAPLFIRGEPRPERARANLELRELSDDEAGESCAVSDTSCTETRRSEEFISPYKNVYSKESAYQSKKTDSSPRSSSYAPDDEKKNKKEIRGEVLKTSDSPCEIKKTPAEPQRPKSGRIVRGMMSGVISSSQEESQRKRSQRRPSAVYSGSTKEGSPVNGKAGEPEGSDSLSPALQRGRDLSVKLLSSFSPSISALTASNTIEQDGQLTSVSQTAEGAADPYNNFKSKFASAIEQEKQQKPSRKSASSSSKRTWRRPILNEEGSPEEDMKLDDVEEDLIAAEVAQISVFNTGSKPQWEGKAIDLQQAVELKKLLFGSTLCSFSEEWKIQSFTFCNLQDLKFGIVQKKGGPCGVLAAVQACLLKNLLFGKESDSSRSLHPSDTLRTSCLYRAIAEILWRAGDSKKAIVTLLSGRQQFTPAGRYKADGILESLIFYSFNSYEDLLTFLQKNVYQFERGPYGCILLTVSAVLSRSTDLVQEDLDDPSGCLIGAHAYCTQELVNLLLGGRAVSNVFNDVVELDSGNGNITILKGISTRSDIGFLSLFEHYGVCQVGSYLKTPKYPIWVVCSESHFSVLFCLKKELVSDWRAERRFDLYYYDGLANQQEEIRLTVDTSGQYEEDNNDELIPPLEHCIRTKWKGAAIDWNGAEPIL
ncbi:putative ubiquitin carboxyl-terminal hydrolase MINDY-4 [Gastrophryne carolinensis]